MAAAIVNLSDVTPLVITFNEEANIERSLGALRWARRIVVVDSGSTDRTLGLVKGVPQAEVFLRRFDDFANQCNWGLERIDTRFTLSLDADHIVTPELLDEIREMADGAADAWTAPFVYAIGGRPLGNSLLPPRVVLFRTAAGRFENDGHAHRVRVTGATASLRGAIVHDDRKPLRRWLASQKGYAELEALRLHATSWRALPLQDRLRKLLLGPLLVFPYCLIARKLIFDGWAGIVYSAQRQYAEILLAIALVRLSGTRHPREPS